jgi:hypothetical protein
VCTKEGQKDPPEQGHRTRNQSFGGIMASSGAAAAATLAMVERAQSDEDQGETVNGRIMSLSSCSTMWQWWT